MPERNNDPKRARLAQTIISPDFIVTEAEKRRCIEAVKAWQEQMTAFRETDPAPALGAVRAAGYHWLDVYCRGCRQVATIALMSVNLHPLVPITRVAAKWRCESCRNDGPDPAIRDVHQNPPRREAALRSARRAALAIKAEEWKPA